MDSDSFEENDQIKELQDIIQQQETIIDRLQQSLDKRESAVSLSEHNIILRKLEDEQIAHAATTSKLLTCEEKLDFALGEIDVLKGQIEREKKQFETTFGMLKTKALKETVKSVDLENKCHVISSQCEEQSEHLVTKDEQIQKLSKKLKSTEDAYSMQLNEMHIRLQQEAYIARVMDETEKKAAKRAGSSGAAKM